MLRSTEPLGPFAPSLAHVFRAGAAAHPDRLLVTHGTRELAWGEAAGHARAIAQALLDLGLSAQRPLLILSGNSIEHLLLTLGAFEAGVPVLPTSTAYSLLSEDHERIRAIAALCTPGLAFADDAEAYGGALDALSGLAPLQVVARGRRDGAVPLAELTGTRPGAAAEDAFARVGPDTVAKLLFTSGSTGAPKGVINTQRMLCSNQQALGQVWPFLHEEPPVLVDWLPWSHTFGGNHNLNQVLAYGGTVHIDDGRPAPAAFERTVDALRSVAPTVYYNVPAAYALLAPRLEQDRELAEHFFSRLRFLFYAAAALPEALWDRLSGLAVTVADHTVPLTAAWGTTETAPGATTAHFPGARCGCIGVPLPGVAIKLAPQGDKLEARVKGPNVTPGYHGNPEATAAAFDDEGYYRTGDAVRLVDEDDPEQGLLFDGRLAEDFKLSTGTFVHVGKLRTGLVSAALVLSDAVICGHDLDCVGALAWLDQGEARRRLGRDGDVAPDDPGLRDDLAQRLRDLNRGAGSAQRVERLLLLDTPPDIDAGEITDKGYINQRAVRERRSAEVRRLFAEPPPGDVIVPDA
ncbi:MAG TPA: feruloyl-CoA synthase [Solirubrobacteraceae bacterium]|nr:feruloyl-CoA synthase [Solirubrobacteraceae bacterium]